MTVAELIAEREPDWKALEEYISKASNPISKRTPEDASKFGGLYRSVCGDLALAKSYQLPPDRIAYLNELVGRAHNCLYRKSRRNWSALSRSFFLDAPRWIVSDPAFWVALVVFWGAFLSCMFVTRNNPDFAKELLGEQLIFTEESFNQAMDAEPFERIHAVAFYIYHNGSIGLQCFALSALGCLPGLYILLSNAVQLGLSFGYMSSAEVDPETYAHFIEFTTAHGPFELTAIVLSAAAGLRIGFGVLSTGGYTRLDSIRRAAFKASPTMVAAFVFFCVAATIEGLISPNSLSWASAISLDALTVKRAIAVVSTLCILGYFVGIGCVGALVNRYWRRNGK